MQDETNHSSRRKYIHDPKLEVKKGEKPKRSENQQTNIEKELKKRPTYSRYFPQTVIQNKRRREVTNIFGNTCMKRPRESQKGGGEKQKLF
jgi:hypothetical protein